MARKMTDAQLQTLAGKLTMDDVGNLIAHVALHEAKQEAMDSDKRFDAQDILSAAMQRPARKRETSMVDARAHIVRLCSASGATVVFKHIQRLLPMYRNE